MVRLTQKLEAHRDVIPKGASSPLIKPRSINDVPIAAFTLWTKRYGGYELRRIATELRESVKNVEGVSEVTVTGGLPRQVRIHLDPERLRAHGLSALSVAQRLREGAPLDEAVVEAGAVRFRPMLLTAAAVIVGAAVLLFEPIFQGLAISLMAGEIASRL